MICVFCNLLLCFCKSRVVQSVALGHSPSVAMFCDLKSIYFDDTQLRESVENKFGFNWLHEIDRSLVRL